MTNYSDIRGYRVKYLSSDPTLNTSTEGQVWYNSTSGSLKGLTQIKAWSSGGNLNTARGYGIGSAGVATAALAFAGETYPGPIVNVTEEYSGYIWTNASNYPQTVWGVGGFGTQTAAVGYAGVQTAAPTTPTNTNEYDGSTWTAGGAVNQHVRYGASAGILTAGLKSSGGSPATNNTEEYNGTSWTTVNSSNTSAEGRVSAGTQTASIFSGGTPETPIGASVESYDGTTWTNLNNAPFPAAYRRGGGTQTHAVFAGGRNPADSPIYLNSSQEFDGVTFVNTPNMATVRWNGGGSGTDASSNTLLFGGVSAPGAGNISATEEYNSSINSITQASWASGGSLSSARRALTMFGHQTAAVVAGGAAPPGTPPAASATEEYNGSSWSSGGALPAASPAAASAGSLTTGLLFGPGTQSLEYDGSTWTAGNSLNSPISLHMGSGTQTTAFSAGGSPNVTQTELYNGTTWTTATGALNTGRQFGQAAGDSAAGLVFGGDTGPGVGNETLASESWDGTSWTATNPMAGVAVTATAGGGTQTQAFSALGAFETAPGPDSLQTQTQEWDGTGWATTANATTARWQTSGSGPASDGGLAAGGTTGTLQTATEEYTYTTTTLNFKTLTTS